MATKEPVNARDGHTVRWSDVWRNGKNLFDLVEKELGSPLPRDREISLTLSARSTNPFARLMYAVDLDYSYLWRDLESIDATICKAVLDVGPVTVSRLVAEFADIARQDTNIDVVDEPSIYPNEVMSALEGVVVDEVMYELYGGTEGGFKRLLKVGSQDEASVDHRRADVSSQLLSSNLQESRRVVRNMHSGIEKGGDLLSTDRAVRWIWGGGELVSLLEAHFVPNAKSRAARLSNFELSMPFLHDRLSLGMSLEEIAKVRGKNKSNVYHRLIRWARYVPDELCVKFFGNNDPRIYEWDTESETAPNEYQHQFVPGWCLNCDDAGVTIAKPLYCSEMCQQMAGTIRYVRACRRDGRIFRPDVKEAIQMRVAQTVAGGYPTKDRRIPDDLRRTVMEGANGQCQKCGRDFDPDDADAIATIQHMDGSSSEPSNLQAWCRRCNMADAQSRFVRIADGSPESRAIAEMKTRWESTVPLRPCDDDERWKDVWQKMAKEAKEELRHQTQVAESASDEDLPGFVGWTRHGTPIQDF